MSSKMSDIADQSTCEEVERLYWVVDEFAGEMKARLAEQALKGYRGWDDPANFGRIVEMMRKHAGATPGQEVDMANLAVFLWYLRRKPEHV